MELAVLMRSLSLDSEALSGAENSIHGVRSFTLELLPEVSIEA
jgi:hypothetical protein